MTIRHVVPWASRAAASVTAPRVGVLSEQARVVAAGSLFHTRERRRGFRALQRFLFRLSVCLTRTAWAVVCVTRFSHALFCKQGRAVEHDVSTSQEHDFVCIYSWCGRQCRAHSNVIMRGKTGSNQSASVISLAGIDHLPACYAT